MKTPRDDMLIKALYDCLGVVQSRIKKEGDCPSGGEYALGYIACAKETETRIQEIISQVNDMMLV